MENINGYSHAAGRAGQSHPAMGVSQMAYIPFLLSVKGPQLKTCELSVLRYEGQEMFLSKPESAPPIEQRWRVTPLRWSAEREPFCILSHRETSRLRLVVAKPDSACELWPVMYSSDKPDGGILNCSISPSRSKLVSFMHKGGLYVLAMERPTGSGGAILQINAPQEPWICVRDMKGGEQSDGVMSSLAEWDVCGKSSVRVTPFYFGEETYMLVQESGRVQVRHVVDASLPWETVNGNVSVLNGSVSSKVLFLYCRNPSSVEGDHQSTCPLSVFAVWVEGCTLYLARILSATSEWSILCTVVVPPHTRLGAMYVPFLSEPLLVSSSMDPHYLGSVAVRRLHLSERLVEEMRGGATNDNPSFLDSVSPRVIRYMQVPALPVAPRDLTADLPINDLPFRDFLWDFVGKRLPFDLTPPHVTGGIPPPVGKPPAHPPISVLLSNGMATLAHRSVLDWIPTENTSSTWRITPLRWAPGREALFVLLQSPSSKTTRVAIAMDKRPVHEWPIQIEFADSSVPFSECRMVPFQYQTVPGSSDLFVMVTHFASGNGGLFFVPSPKSEWQFVRAVNECPELLDQNHDVKVMYHRSKDVNSVNLCTFFVLTGGSQDGTKSPMIRVVLEPNQPTFDVSPTTGGVASSIPQFPSLLTPIYVFSPKPPVTHVWPCEVFFAYIHNDQLVVSHVSSPDSPWRLLYSQAIPSGVTSMAPVYLPYFAEPLLLMKGADRNSNAPFVDLLRLNLVEAYTSGGSASVTPKFIHRYLLDSRNEVEDVTNLLDPTMDTALVWIPQMGLQGMHPYTNFPLPMESNPQ